MPGAEDQQANRPHSPKSTSSNESKPSCSQCIDRGVECGGYVRSLKWKVVGEQPQKRSRLEDRVIDYFAERQHQSSETISIEQIPGPTYENVNLDDHNTAPSLQAETSLSKGIARTNNILSPRTQEEHLWQSLPQDHLFDFADVDFNVDFFLGDSNIHLNVPPELGSPVDTQSTHGLEGIEAHAIHLRKEKAPDLSGLISSPQDTAQDFRELKNHDRSLEPFSSHLHTASACSPPGISRRHHNSEDDAIRSDLYSSLPDTPKTVKQLFDKHLCHVLSIKDDRTTNPWTIHVWPLAERCPVLYHALAAMTYLYLSNSHPEFGVSGSSHFHASLQAFTQDQSDTTLEASLAARLALGFAEAWDNQSLSSGVDHVRIAGRILQEAFDKDRITRLTSDEQDRLSFLARTWVYKAVLLRLTTSDDGESIDLDSVTAYIQLERLPAEQQLDPLLGCAVTLFPLIAGLTDIIRAVRRRTEKRNSPSIISRAAELWTAIESWSPSFDPQRSGSVPSHISDIIQTAEAYRWAALLLLRHAVPELPWAHSFWELAEKVLIYLATTPASSRTIVIQTFPLMAIGGEAFDEDDRDWVCQRWDAMAKRMPLPSLHRCQNVTKEVWRRKDAFEAQLGACPSCGASRGRSTGISPSMDTLPDAESVASSQDREEGSRRCRCNAVTSAPMPASNFPDSLAFKKGIDNITRAGHLHYTVRGELHWLKVMEDWKWQVPLG
ncbi:hypothetical protein AYL99_08453 [Fonsecaea erecta]|uniref:Zn(2)-C6 fungal-type domain-containing protein n=1 Tax=Fonsecaea erecta TaxID=1367422 RepID=A0A178ZF78_9EURO|nr:hypothetical protein AYL99_08453 [Fonsecaea erecta]OAP57715.1 hypothetical protein AYL99_08453 [Fonsecaea erecta]